MVYGETILSLHQKIKNNELSLQEYYQSLFHEFNIQQQRLNCFVSMTPDYVEKHMNDEIGKESILYKIPVVYKDNCSTVGVKTTASSKMLENYKPIFNATVVEKLYQNGMLLAGKTSMDELAMGGTNQSALTGPVSNPWDVTRISGGSSGGSAAIVASGVVPFAIGSDTGDSIRKPAAFCGVVGFKPTWGRISRYGVIPYASSLDHVGAFTRCVEDMAIVIEAMSGRDDHDMTSSDKEVPQFYKHLNKEIKGLRIANIKNISRQIKDPEIKKNYEEMINQYKELGCIVEDVELNDELLRSILPVYTIISNAEATSNHACLDGINYGLRVEGKSSDETMILSRTAGFSQNIKTRYILGSLALSTQNQERMFRKAKRVRRLIVEEVNQIFNQYDVILTPCSNGIAPKIHEQQTIDRLSDEFLMLENHLALGNFSGLPSITIPSGFAKNMPIGINIMGKAFDDQTVLNVAYALESVLPYKNQYARGDQS